ncbi:MAG: hypothetical protein JW956_07015, partial [Calditrichaceae bacterium]|nr:hypothetical protein [Calditrichaceae bacterium]
NYPFRMTYEYGSNQKSQDIGVDPVVVFTTVKARVQLESSLGDPLDTGYVQYYASGWRDLGTTVNGESAKELLPNNYPIRMTYEYGSNQKSQDIGSNPIVVFPTVNTIVQLKDSSGVLIDPGTVKYYASGWRDFGQTSGGQAEKELLPKNYTFRMISDFGTEQKAQDTGVDPIVIFQVAGAPTYPELVLQQPAQGLITNDANIAVSGSVDDANTVVTVNGEPVTVQADGSFTTTITAVEGQNTITVVATNVENNSRTEIRNIILDTTKPAIAVFSPDDETYTNEDSIQIVGNVFDSTETTLTIDGQNAILDTDNNFFFDFNLQNGLNDIHFVAQDAAGNFRYDTLSVYLDTTAPVIGSVNPAEGSTVDISRPVIEITFSDDLSGLDFSTLNVLLNTDNISNDFVINGNIASFSTSAELQDGIYTLDISVNDNAGNSLNNHISTFTIETEELPSDPVEVATPLKTTEVTSFLDANMFLYSGPDPIQTGADSAAFDERRTAILRGKTLNSNGESISGVTVTILDHDEYGQTLTRSDGYFDMAVNGGGILTVSFEKNGLFSVQRTVDVPWQDFVELDSVVMINEDTKVSLIDFSEDVQVHRGSIVSDDDGTRQANLFFKQGMQAQIILPDSSILNLDSMHVRVTEYTVGDNGPQAMPANLPDNIAYTYCVELSVDEAVAMNAEKVEFDSPVYVYVDNFLGFPVGLDVPSGYYDRKLKGWVPSENGKVIEIVGINNGLAEIDADGDGIAEDANSLLTLGFNDAERSRLADIYSSGSTLWRVGVSHFSAWDFNWSYGLPGDAKAANQEKASNKEDQVENPCKGEGSIIGIQDQDLRQQIPVVGTEFSLNYSSKRMYGRIPYLDIPLSGSSIPASLLRIDLYVKIAGKTNKFSYPPISNLTKRFIWDRKDVYGRIVWGSQKVKISIAYVYEAVYKTSSEISKDFAQFGDAVTDVRTRQEIEVWQKYNTTLTSWYNPNMELGGWSINVNHKYDPVNGVLAYGDGTFRNANFLGNSITTVAGNGEYGYDGDGGMANAASMGWVTDVAIGPNGNIFICDPDYSVIRMIDSSGIISTVAGGGDGGGGTIIGAAATSLPTTNHVELGDGGPATEASLFYPSQIAVGGDGSLYIADTFNNLIRIVDQNGIISTIAGNEDWGYSENGTLAIESELMFPMGIAIGPDGLIYFADESYVRRINADGTLTTIAGNDEPSGVPEDGLLATDIGLYYPNALNFDKDGNLYIADNTLNRILKVTPEGLIYVVAGSGAIYYPGSYIFPPGRGDGGLATEAIIYEPSDVVFGPDGSMYISESSNNNIRKVSPGGIISRYAGRYSPSDEANLPEIGDGDFAPSAYLNYPQGVAVSQNSELYIIDGGHNKLRKVSENLFHSSNNIIASEDGSEL